MARPRVYLLFVPLLAVGAKQHSCLGITWPLNTGMLQSFNGVFAPQSEPRRLSNESLTYRQSSLMP